jgi:hypothetical protein
LADLATELLLKLTDETVMDFPERFPQFVWHMDDNSLPAARDVDLPGTEKFAQPKEVI